MTIKNRTGRRGENARTEMVCEVFERVKKYNPEVKKLNKEYWKVWKINQLSGSVHLEPFKCWIINAPLRVVKIVVEWSNCFCLVTNSVSVLGHWVNSWTERSTIEPHNYDSVLIKKI